MDFVCIGKIVKSHGVRGAIKIESYTQNPVSLADYKPLFLFSNLPNASVSSKNHSSDNRPCESDAVKVEIISCKDKFLICKMPHITNRNDAELSKGKKIYTLKQSLPELEDEDDFYIEDLIGIDLQVNGEKIGIVEDVKDFGAGSILIIKFTDSGKSEMFSFTKEIFPHVDIHKKLIIFNSPEMFEAG